MIIPVHGASAPASDDAKKLAGRDPEYYLDSANIKFTDTESVSQTLGALAEKLSGSSLVEVLERVHLLESTLFNEIETNPFTIRLDDLTGLDVTGTWNPALGRIEC